MKKVIKSAVIGITLLAVIQFSGNAIITFAAKQLLAPYYIVGIIMLVGSFFGVYFGRKGGRILYGIIAFFMSAAGGLLLSFSWQTAVAFLSDKIGVAKNFIVEIDWLKILYVVLGIIGSLGAITGIVFLIRFFINRKNYILRSQLLPPKTHTVDNTSKIKTDEIKVISEAIAFETAESKATDFTPLPSAIVTLVAEENHQEKYYTLRELWFIAGRQPFKAISTYEDIAWVKIYKDPTKYKDVYGWLKMEHARDADNRQIFYADEKCWRLVDIIKPKIREAV